MQKKFKTNRSDAKRVTVFQPRQKSLVYITAFDYQMVCRYMLCRLIPMSVFNQLMNPNGSSCLTIQLQTVREFLREIGRKSKFSQIGANLRNTLYKITSQGGIKTIQKLAFFSKKKKKNSVVILLLHAKILFAQFWQYTNRICIYFHNIRLITFAKGFKNCLTLKVKTQNTWNCG